MSSNTLIPPPGAAFVDDGGTWTPLTSSDPQGAQPVFTPPPVGLYAFSGGQWVPWSGAGGGGGAPSGPAGGDLAGNYPNPTVKGSSVNAVFSANGAASAPSVSITGIPFTGGGGTTTVPLLYLNNGATAPTTWNAAGTEIGVNAPAGFSGNFIDCRVNGSGSTSFSVSASGTVVAPTLAAGSNSVQLALNKVAASTTALYGWTATASATSALDTTLSRSAAGVVQVGSGSTSNSLGSLQPGQIIGGSGAPAIAAGTGAGTGPTVGVAGNNTAGKITVTSGTTPTPSGPVVTVTFANAFAYGAAPYACFSPANAAAAALTGGAAVFVSTTTTTLVLNAGPTALAAGTQYVWNYVVQG